MRDKWHVKPDPSTEGARLAIMMKDTIVVITPSNTEIDRFMADYICSALRMHDDMGLGPEEEG